MDKSSVLKPFLLDHRDCSVWRGILKLYEMFVIKAYIRLSLVMLSLSLIIDSSVSSCRKALGVIVLCGI